MNSTNGSGKLESIKNKIEMARGTKWKKGMKEKPLRPLMQENDEEESSNCVEESSNHVCGMIGQP